MKRAVFYWTKLVLSGRVRTCSSLRLFSSSSYSGNEDQLSEILDRVVALKREGRGLNQSTLRSRHLRESIWQLKMEAKRIKIDTSNHLSLLAPPVHATLEVLSNGTGHMKPCVFIRTALRIYLFDCPEGCARFLNTMRIRPSMIRDVFITRGTWDCIGGLSSLMIAKVEHTDDAEMIQLHGSGQLKKFMECIRPFADSDYDRQCAKHVGIEERSHDLGHYDDGAITVDYVPLSVTPQLTLDPFGMNEPPIRDERHGVSLSYLVRLKPPPQRIDPQKLLEFGVPPGPLVGKLKAGEKIQLSNGRMVLPENVLADDNRGDEISTVLVVRCDHSDLVPSLIGSSALRPYYSFEEKLRYVVHLSKEEVMQTPIYSKWMNSLGPDVHHIIVNGTGPQLPHVVEPYRNQHVHRLLQPNVFPPLVAADFDTILQQDEETKSDDRIVLAKPLQRFFLRGRPGRDNSVESVSFAKKNLEIDLPIESLNLISHRYKCEQLAIPDQVYPQLSLLGTSSSIFTKFRNMSGYLLEMNPDSCLIVDCGEGTFGQLKVLFHDRLDTLLRSLHMVLITHAHQDHCFGLYSIVQERQRAFERAGIPYIPMLLGCNRNVITTFNAYSTVFNDLRSLVKIINLTQSDQPWQPTMNAANWPKTDAEAAKATFVNPVVNLLKKIPDEFAQNLGLHQLLAVRVHHTRLANGFVMVTENERRKVVFSGDTMPCDLLVEQGANADILLHEATFDDKLERDAFFKKHSTMRQAVDVGVRMKARNIILTHFSARYPRMPPLPEYLDQLGNVAIGLDNMVIPFGQQATLPLLTPLYRIIYSEKLEEYDARSQMRVMRDRKEDEKKLVAQRL